MKEKIKEALRLEYKGRLELSEEALEGVATFGTTYVKDETQVNDFVKGAEPMLKTFQSDTDKLRQKYSAKIKELEGAQNSKNKDGETNAESNSDTGNNVSESEIAKLAKAINDSNKANADLIASMKAEIDAFKGEQAVKKVLAEAEKSFKDNRYVKAYSEQADDAWDRALEIYETGGKKMTADELSAKAMGYFNKAVAKKGVDTSKPFEGDGGGDSKTNASKFLKALKDTGRIADAKK